jgi:hypothetical protein
VECCLLVSWLDVRDKKGNLQRLVECKAQKNIALGRHVASYDQACPVAACCGYSTMATAVWSSRARSFWNKVCISVA